MKNLFISYSHKDESYKNELANHLFPLELAGKIKIWQDGMIQAGSKWDDSIKKNLEDADIVLLVLSSDALTSTYINNVEIKKAMEAHDTGTKTVIPVIIRPCKWTVLPMSKVQAVPKWGKAVSTWKNRDEAYLDIVNRIEAIL